jgi:hypothetical protein
MAVSCPVIAEGSNQSSTLRETRPVGDDNSAASVVFLPTGPAPWLKSVWLRLAASAEMSPVTDLHVVERAFSFLAALPSWIPGPFVAVGDSGIVDIEWESSEGDLTISFSASSDDVSWLGADDTEWEGPLGPTPQLASRLLAVSRP